jgi:glycine reductase
MKLELADFFVRDVQFRKETTYNNGVLNINKEELVALVLEDNRIDGADLDVAFPGEKTRIIRIRDIVEPRVKVSGPGCVFPGILGPVETVGDGRTHRLSGVTVIASVQYRPTIPTGSTAQKSGLVDMWGPGSLVTPFSSTINIVLIFKLIEGLSELEAHNAIQLAEFKVAQRLAETSKKIIPENVEVFELSKVDSSLPQVVYILSFVTEAAGPHSYEAYYGLSIRESLPTFIHPNELLDGALTTDTRRGNGSLTTTWGWLNQPVVYRLLREHGKRLSFLGVILQRTRFESEHGKHVTAAATSQMAKLLGADGAIITRTSVSGNNFIDVMLTLQACERKGTKTVLLGPEWGGESGTEIPLVFYVPEATAMVTTGSIERKITLPAPTKVIGDAGSEVVELAPGEAFSPWNETIPPEWGIMGCLDWWGGMKMTRKEY